MAITGNESFLTQSVETATLVNSCILVAQPGSGMQLNHSTNQVAIVFTGNVDGLNSVITNGICVLTGGGSMVTRAFDSSTTIDWEVNGGGNYQANVAAATSVQLVQLALNGISLGVAWPTINFIPGSGISITPVSNAFTGSFDVTFAFSGSAGGAPTNATYLTKTPNSTLSDEFALSLLATGILKNTTTTGNLTISAPLTSIDGLTPALGSMLVGASSSTYISRPIGTAGQVPTVNGGGTDWAWTTPTGGGGAPTDATYITQTPSSGLSGEQALSLLTPGGSMKCNSSGVVSISAPLTSIDGLTPALGSTLVGASSSTYISRPIGSAYNIQVVNSGGTDWAWGSRIFDTGGSDNNLFVGILSGNNTLTGGDNTGSGFTAGQALTTGNNNSLFGAGAGVALTTGEFNTVSGSSALTLATGSNSNTVVGFNAASAQLIYNNSLYLGVGADAANNNLNNAAAVGNNSLVSRSNQFALGGSISGVGQQITIGQADPQSGVTRTSSLILGTDNGLNPHIYFKDSSAPSKTNIAANDGVLSVASGLPQFSTADGGTFTTGGNFTVPVYSGSLGASGTALVSTGTTSAPTWQAITDSNTPIIYNASGGTVGAGGTPNVSLILYTPDAALLALLKDTTAPGYISVSASFIGNTVTTSTQIGLGLFSGGIVQQSLVNYCDWVGTNVSLGGISNANVPLSIFANASAVYLAITVTTTVSSTITAFQDSIQVTYYPSGLQ